MSILRIFVTMNILLSQSLPYADDWIGLEPEAKLTLGFLYNQDQSDNSSRTLYLSRLLGETGTLNIELSEDRLQNRRETFNSQRLFTQLLWQFKSNTHLAFSYQFQGKQTELEDRQYAIQFGYEPYPAFFTVEMVQGEVIIFTREEIPDEFSIPESLQSDYQASSLQIGWWFEQFTLSARHQVFEYERDISALARRELFLLLVKPAALVQTGLLLSDRTTLSIDYPLDQRLLSAHLMQTRSAINKQQTRSVQLDWQENLNRSTSLILNINRSDEEQDYWSFSIGLEWIH